MLAWRVAGIMDFRECKVTKKSRNKVHEMPILTDFKQ